MSRLIAGALLGFFLGVLGSALAANIVGTGKLDGWTVLDDDGDTVCVSPEVNGDKKEIKCARIKD
jgi:hypothetical protein